MESVVLYPSSSLVHSTHSCGRAEGQGGWDMFSYDTKVCFIKNDSSSLCPGGGQKLGTSLAWLLPVRRPETRGLGPGGYTSSMPILDSVPLQDVVSSVLQK